MLANRSRNGRWRHGWGTRDYARTGVTPRNGYSDTGIKMLDLDTFLDIQEVHESK